MVVTKAGAAVYLGMRLVILNVEVSPGRTVSIAVAGTPRMSILEEWGPHNFGEILPRAEGNSLVIDNPGAWGDGVIDSIELMRRTFETHYQAQQAAPVVLLELVKKVRDRESIPSTTEAD